MTAVLCMCSESDDPIWSLGEIEVQMADCSKYAEQHGIETLMDLGAGSAAGLSRPGFSEMIDLPDGPSRPTRTVIIARRSVLGRNTVSEKHVTEAKLAEPFRSVQAVPTCDIRWR